MTVKLAAYSPSELPATVLRYDGKTLHSAVTNPHSLVDQHGNVVLTVSTIDQSTAAAPAPAATQGEDASSGAQNQAAHHAAVNVTA